MKWSRHAVAASSFGSAYRPSILAYLNSFRSVSHTGSPGANTQCSGLGNVPFNKLYNTSLPGEWPRGTVGPEHECGRVKQQGHGPAKLFHVAPWMMWDSAYLCEAPVVRDRESVLWVCFYLGFIFLKREYCLTLRIVCINRRLRYNTIVWRTLIHIMGMVIDNDVWFP